MVEGIGVAKVAFGSALTAVRAFIGGLTAMKAAMVTTGIGALVVGLGLLIQYLIESGDEAETAKSKIDELNESFATSANRLAVMNSQANAKIWNNYVEAVKKAGNDADKLKQAGEKLDKDLKAQELKDAESNVKNLQENLNTLKANKRQQDKLKVGDIEDVEEMTEEDYDKLVKQIDEVNTQLKQPKRTLLR